MQNFKDFLLWEKASRDTIDVKRVYVDICGDLIAGIMLSQIIYWHLPDVRGRSKLRVYKDDKFWVAKEHNDWWEECRITQWQSRRAIKILGDKGLIEKKYFMFNGRRTTHIRLIENNLISAINDACNFNKIRSESFTTTDYSESLQPITETTPIDYNKKHTGLHPHTQKVAENTENYTTDSYQERIQSIVHYYDKKKRESGFTDPLRPLRDSDKQVLNSLIIREGVDWVFDRIDVYFDEELYGSGDAQIQHFLDEEVQHYIDLKTR